MKQTLRFGASLSLTGSDYSLQGVYMKEGYLLFQEHANARGGIDGRPLQFVILDDRSDPQAAVENYERLIRDGVDVLLGPYGSTMTEAVADLAERHERLLIAPTAGMSGSWNKGRKYLVQMIGPLETAGAGIFEIARNRGIQSLAILSEASPVTQMLAEAAIGAGAGYGLNVISHQQFQKGTSDFAAFLESLQVEPPDLLIITSLQLDDLAAIARGLRLIGLSPKMTACLPYGMLPDFHSKLGLDAEYIFAASPWEACLPYEHAREFVDSYEGTYGRPPAVQSAASYAACQVLQTAIETLGSTEQEALRDFVMRLKTKTVFGDFEVDSRGSQIGQKAVITQWQGGAKVVVWPEQVSNGAIVFPAPATTPA